MKLVPWTHSPRSTSLDRQRRTIGVVVDNLVDGYQRMIFGSIARTAREHDANVLVFVGGTLPSNHYDLIGKANVDALILTSATLWRRVGLDGFYSFCSRFAEMPVCSIGLAVPGVSSIVTNDSPGAGALVTHLLADHRKKEIACIRGPGADGQERFEAFRRTLDEFGVETRAELIVDGDFTESSGREAVRILHDERKVRFDAIVAGNDYMALGAIAALEERDLSVPGDISVVGFDDIEDARHAAVPLTTVRQPIRELGKRAVLQVLQQLDEGDSAAAQAITCHPLKRRSCGCVVESPFTRRPASASHKFPDPETALSARRELVLADMTRTAQGELGNIGYDWERELFSSIQEELRGAVGTPFLTANERLSRRVFLGGGDVSTWQRVLATLRHHVLECVGDNLRLRATAENAFYDAVILSGSVVGREDAQKRDALAQLLRTAVRTGNTLMTSIDPEQLGSTLVEHLRSLDIPSCYLAVWSADRTEAKLVVGFDRQLTIERTDSDAGFKSTDLVPTGILPRDRGTVYAVMPLEHEEHSLGFALFEYREDDGVLFEILRDQFAAALEAAGRR
ncbi:MAG: substrate-binding domain-containing protein [Polyangiaceae bacterium]|nr:substrate-binding domain-containing protein [Polyangiaceae bacterium]